jgi:3-dehydroquinate synthase II
LSDPRARVWILVPPGASKAHVTGALEAGFTTLVAEGDPAELAGLARVRVLRLDAEGVHEGETMVAPRVEVRSPADQERALALAGRHEAVHVDARDWRVIPHENLIAAYRKKGTRLVTRAEDAADAKLQLETLETGVDAVILPVQHARAMAETLRAAEQEKLVEARITRIKPVGLGDRACLDTASLLRENEGVLTGSASGGLFLVASEARESGYVAGRPFRVNAGAVHAYVLVPGGRTRYLSELHAGDEILAVDPEGRARTVVLGRVKIERRPLLLLVAETGDGHRVHTLLQNAETIRLVGPQGTRSVVDLKEGDTVLVRLDTGGRHFGMSVDETVLER